MSGWTTPTAGPTPCGCGASARLPALGIATDWCLRGAAGRPSAPWSLACWAGNFYIAAMATIGMGLVFAVRLLLDDAAGPQASA